MSDTIRQMQDFCDMERLSRILEKWANGTGMEVLLEDPKDRKQVLEFGETRCCKKIREFEEGVQMCKCSRGDVQDGIFRCRAGMHNFVLPITLPDGRVIINLFAGGVILLKDKVAAELDAREVLRSFGVDEEEIDACIEDITVKKESEIEGAYELLKEMLQDFVDRSYQVWCTKQELKKEMESGQELRAALENVGIGTWIAKVPKDGKVKMYADHNMNSLMGCSDGMNPERRFEYCYSRICREYLEDIDVFQQEIRSEGQAEVTFSWESPETGRTYGRIGGALMSESDSGKVYRGYYQDITDKMVAQQRDKDSMDAVRAFSSLYSGTWKVCVEQNKVESIKSYFYKEADLKKLNHDATEVLLNLIDSVVEKDCRKQLEGIEDISRTARRLKRRRSMNWEYKAIDGKWYCITAVPLQKDGEGNVLKILYGVQEITDEKNKELEANRQLEQANRVISKQLETISSAMPGGFKISYNDPKYTFKYVSEHLAHMLGYTLEEFYEASGGCFSGIINMDDIQKELPKALEMYSKGDTYVMKYRLRCKDGSWKYVMDRGRKVYQPDGTFENWCLILDVDEQEHLYQMLQEERLQYREALLQDSVYFYNFDATEGIIHEKIRLKNGQCPMDNMGITPPVKFDELVERFLETVNPTVMSIGTQGFPKQKDMLNAYKEGRKRCELEYYDPSIEQYHRMVILLSEREVDGHVLACVIGQDITEQKTKLEKAFAEARRASKAKSEFLSRMSHDIRTPMNGIMGMTKIAKASLGDDDRVEDALKKIEAAGSQLQMLINDVLDMSRLESGKTELSLESFDIKEIVANAVNAVRTLADEKRVRIRPTEYETAHTRVIGSPLHTQRVLLNVLSNAIKYNKESGSIEISIKQTDKDENHADFRFRIADTGIGMSKEFMKRMFEPFSREHTDAGTKYQGTGLGMPIMKELVDLMGGTIEVESEVDEGTTISVTLPFELDFTEAPQEAEEEKENLEGMRILLVEDNQINMEIAKFLLESAGAEIFTADNGKKAVDYFSKTSQGDLDLILMDVMMPVMDGIRATRLIRQSPHEDAKTIPIVAMTANAFVEDMKKTKEAGMNAHLSKPLDPEKVMQVLYDYKKAKEQKDEA